MRLFKGIPFPGIIDWKKTNNLDKGGPVVSDERDSLTLGYYVLESNGFGWINCDKFSNVPNKINVTFTAPANTEGNACLVFTGIKSIMSGDFFRAAKNNIIFHNVPDGMEAVLLIYYVNTEKKKVFYATQKVILGIPPTDDLKFTESTPEQFKGILKTIQVLY